MPAHRPSDERFWEKVQKTGTCWLWTGSTFQKGYGNFHPGVHHPGESHFAHVWSWEAMYGKKPEGMQLDHTCLVKRCVNPLHLRLVTNKQNCEHREGRMGGTSAHRGVSLHKKTGKWQARVGHNGQEYYRGLYPTEEEAAAAARAGRNELFTHNDLDRRAA